MNERERFLRTQAMIFCVAGILAICFYVLPKPLSRILGGCLMHDLLWLYCPLCGGTRAVGSLARGAFLEAIRYNALAVVGGAVFAVLEVVAWVCFFLKKPSPVRLGKRFWIVCGVVALLFFICRNVLMIAFGVDTVGDLGGAWHAIRG